MIHRLLLVLVIAGFAAPLAASEPPAWDWTIPNNLHAEATGPEGRVVTFTVTARYQGNDATVVCTPPSGSTFPLGRTEVVCVATYQAQQDTRAPRTSAPT